MSKPTHPDHVRELAVLSKVATVIGHDDEGRWQASATPTRLTVYADGQDDDRPARHWHWPDFLAGQVQGDERLFWGAYLLTLEWSAPEGLVGPIDALARLAPPS